MDYNYVDLISLKYMTNLIRNCGMVRTEVRACSGGCSSILYWSGSGHDFLMVLDLEQWLET